MNQDLSNKRQVYNKYQLLETDLPENPMELFRNWYDEADNNAMISEANAMSISTIEDNFRPRSRMVLLKKFTWEGFIFYTNYNSRKAKAITENNEVCLHFFWHQLEKQIIISAKAEKIAQNLSDGYFAERPRGSQLGAIVSTQSQVIPNRNFLEEKLGELEKSTEGKELQRPNFWGGFIAKPYQIEFWQGRPNRLHDRILYTLQDDFNWKIERLAP